MAEVFVADVVDPRVGSRTVALKLMRPEASREAFDAEADLMGMVRHPNLVERLEVGEAFGRPFIAMEHFSGGDLARVVHLLQRRGEPFPQPMAFHVALEALKALAYFHQMKGLSGRPLRLIHGDVTPANIFFSAEATVKLGDFGVAKSHVAGVGPDDEVAAGKLHYLSPEQTLGKPLGPGSDLFSLGVVLFELLVGAHPFHEAEGTTESVLEAMQTARFQAPSGLDKPLVALLRKALHPDPKSRFRTAGEMAGMLLHYVLDHGADASREDVAAWLRAARTARG